MGCNGRRRVPNQTHRDSRAYAAPCREAPVSRFRLQILGESPVRLWGLTSRERLLRQAAGLGIAEGAGKALEDKVLLVRADYLYEPRTLSGLMRRGGVLMDEAAAAAAAVAAADAPAAAALLSGTSAAPEESGAHLPRLSVHDLGSFEGDPRKSAPPLLERITAADVEALENRLYGASYKGVTDFVTKWWWPAPAKRAVRWCADRRISPNSVTVAGLLLMFATCWLFFVGWFAAGLVLAWIMTFLDTVDGKLARVRVQSSKAGHWLDHGMDILHPPFWYWFWGLALTPLQPSLGLSFNLLMGCILWGYVGGRLIEAAFHALGQASLFAWRPFDAYFRLFTARRNPCLVLLTAGWLVGSPAWGFRLVALWTLASTLVLLVRLGVACFARIRQGPLTSWLAEPDAAHRHPRAHRLFASTQRAYR